MVKSSSRPRKTSKFVIDLGPEIDKVVKKKIQKRDEKIKKQKCIILALENQITTLSDDPKIRKQKVIIIDLETKLLNAEKRVKEAEDETRKYKVRRVNISNKTVENAFKNLRDGKSLWTMQPNTILLIQQSGRWEEARRINLQKKLC
tara:strand:- start:538 stop:978 length:441 start_codon:yes stop_codon:yes gene_type:complete